MTERHAWLPTKDEYEELFTEFNNGSQAAKQELIERHVRLVASIALKFRLVNALWKM